MNRLYLRTFISIYGTARMELSGTSLQGRHQLVFMQLQKFHLCPREALAMPEIMRQ